MKRILIIGANWEKVPLIKEAQSMGYYVIATDPDPDAEGLGVADAGEILDPRNLTGAVLLAKKHNIDGVTADQCDYSHFAAVYVSTLLGLPNDGLAAAQHTTNKRWMREVCREHGILQPRFFACRTMAEVKRAAELIDYPLIIKPVDNRGSFGVHRVDSGTVLEPAYMDALANSYSREVLVEDYIEGTHITVDGYASYNLGIASKKITPGEKPIITEVFYPAEVATEMQAHILKTNKKVIEALGITSGATHSEYIVDAGGRCFLLETANRGGGVLTSALIIPEISGVNVSRLLVAHAMGETCRIEPEGRQIAVMLSFLTFPAGKVREITGTTEAALLKGVLHLKLNIKKGQTIRPPKSGAERHGFVILAGKDRLEVRKLYEKVTSLVRVQV